MANEIHEDQLRNFLVNTLSAAFGVTLGANVDIAVEDIYEVLVGATSYGSSISTLCNRSDDSPSGNGLLYHLRTKFDLDSVKAVGNTLLQEYTLSVLPNQVEVVADLHLRPYYSDKDDTDGFYQSEAKAGTTAFHAYDSVRPRAEQTLHVGCVSGCRWRHYEFRPG